MRFTDFRIFRCIILSNHLRPSAFLKSIVSQSRIYRRVTVFCAGFAIMSESRRLSWKQVYQYAKLGLFLDTTPITNKQVHASFYDSFTTLAYPYVVVFLQKTRDLEIWDLRTITKKHQLTVSALISDDTIFSRFTLNTSHPHILAFHSGRDVIYVIDIIQKSILWTQKLDNATQSCPFGHFEGNFYFNFLEDMLDQQTAKKKKLDKEIHKPSKMLVWRIPFQGDVAQPLELVASFPFARKWRLNVGRVPILSRRLANNQVIILIHIWKPTKGVIWPAFVLSADGLAFQHIYTINSRLESATLSHPPDNYILGWLSRFSTTAVGVRQSANYQVFDLFSGKLVDEITCASQSLLFDSVTHCEISGRRGFSVSSRGTGGTQIFLWHVSRDSAMPNEPKIQQRELILSSDGGQCDCVLRLGRIVGIENRWVPTQNENDDEADGISIDDIVSFQY
jgi:hypothetical protein